MNVMYGENKDLFYNYTDTNFNFAFSLVGMVQYYPYEFDVEGYLTVKVDMFNFGFSGFDRTELGTHPCTVEEKEANFNELLPMYNYSEPFFEYGLMMCFDDPG